MKSRDSIFIKRYHFPCGELMLGSYGEKLCLCRWVDCKNQRLIDYRLQRMLSARFVENGTNDVIELARQQLNDYFWNKSREFNVPLLFIGTDFQKSVWNELLTIPYGTTVSYGDIAQRLGDPESARAVANACALNAINIIVPCHRIIGNNGNLKGYSGGLQKKEYLLDMEQRILLSE